jgi:putative tryptophan/tyrosine transport system substrate-binding protein
MEGTSPVSPSMTRRQLLRGLLYAFAPALTIMAGCKQPVPPVSVARPTATVRPTSTTVPLRPIRVGLLYPGSYDGQAYPAHRFSEAFRTAGFVAASPATRSFSADPHLLLMAPGQLAVVRDEQIAHGAEILFAPSFHATVVARQATNAIPIVTISPNDLVASGLIRDLAMPGGNITGVTSYDPLRGAKALNLLTEVVPVLSRLAIFWNPDEADRDTHAAELRVAAQALGLLTYALPARSPDAASDAMQQAMQHSVEAAISLGDPLVTPHQLLLSGLAEVFRLPILFERNELVRSGGLLSLGPSIGNLWKHAGDQAARIAGGAVPSTLAVVQDTSVELAVNLRTARAFGVQIPAGVLSLATEVIP